MPNWKLLLLGLAIAILVRALYYARRLITIRHMKDQYTEYLRSETVSVELITSYIPRLKKIAKECGEVGSVVPFVEPMGLGVVAQGHLEAVQNLANRRQDTVVLNLALMDRIAGACRDATLDCLKPWWWLEQIALLPQALLQYVGINREHFTAKIATLVYWALAGATLLLEPWREAFWRWLRDSVLP